jgi:tetratricopeptide (TPR) repeat protein
MVQDDVRYLYVALEQGGLVPASAEETWRRRFGDCKGKTALLLSMLHGLGLQAEPVLVDSFTGDALPDRLPMVGAFDHVLVRAEIDGHTYWLDGTRSGDRTADHIVTPLFHWGLPVRLQGAELVEIRPAPLAEPDTSVAIHLDFSAGLTAPGKVEGEVVFRGDAASLTQQSAAVSEAAELDRVLRDIWAAYYPAARIDSVAGRSDPSTGEYVVTVTGTVRSLWQGARYRSVVGDLAFPATGFSSRSEEENQEAPFAVVFPEYTSVRETLTLPNEGRGFSIDGEEIDVITSGLHVRRSARVEGANLIIEGSTRSLASELSASEAKAAERRLAALGGSRLYVIAPTNYRASEEEQRAALGPKPVSAEDFVNRGLVHLNNGRHELAVQDFTSAVELAPTNAYTWANRGLAFAYRNEADRARQDFEAAQAIDPNNVVAFRGYGLLAIHRTDYGEAIEHFTRAIEIDSDNDFSYNMRSRARMATTDLEGAFEDSLAATRLNPAMPEPYVLRATVSGMRGRDDQALAEFDAMLESAYPDARSFRAAAQMLARLGERGKAIDAITRAFEAQPTAGDLLMRAQLREPDDLNGRRADLEAALELEPRSREARLGLARMHVEADQPDEAIGLLDELVERDPKDVVALGERGIAHVRSGDTDVAAADFDAARAAAGNAARLNALCWRKATLKIALDEALKDCLLAVEREANPAAYDSLGFVYLRLGRYEDSVTAYDSALGMRANQAESLFGRALAKRELGDQAGYEQDMRDAARWQPEIDKVFAQYGVTN